MSAAAKVRAVKSAVSALTGLSATIDIRPDDEAEFLELAANLGATVRGHAVIYPDSPSLGAVWLFAFDVVRSGVTVHCQGTRPATPAEIEHASISESEPPVTPERRAAALAKLAERQAELRAEMPF